MHSLTSTPINMNMHTHTIFSKQSYQITTPDLFVTLPLMFSLNTHHIKSQPPTFQALSHSHTLILSQHTSHQIAASNLSTTLPLTHIHSLSTHPTSNHNIQSF